MLAIMGTRGGSRLVRGTAAVAVLAGLQLAAACGSDDTASDSEASTGAPTGSSTAPSTSASVSPSAPSTSASPSASPAPASWSGCATVWKGGARLPAAYPGCAESGTAVPAHRIDCSSGQVVVTYAEHFFAVPGGLIKHTSRELKNSPTYAAAIATCRG